MNTKTLAPCIGVCLMATTAPVLTAHADPLIIRTSDVGGQLVEGMHDGWTVAISDTGINGDEVLVFVSAPSYRVLEYDAERDTPIQPVPAGCFPLNPREMLGLGPWPEGNVTVLGWDGTNWAARSTLTSIYVDQPFWSTAWGTSISVTPDGEYLLIGSTGSPGISYKTFIGDDCTADNELLPGFIIPQGHLDLYQYTGADWTPVATLGPPTSVIPASRVQAPKSGQPTALCACAEEFALPITQNGLGWSTAMLVFDNAGRDNVLLLSGIPWYDGNGAYPVFSADIDTGEVFGADDTEGTCCYGDGTADEGITSNECARLGGVILSDDFAGASCAAISACCVGDACAGDMLAYDCRLIGGFPYPDEICDDDPCPSDITLPVFAPDASDPTACARGGAFLVLYDPLTDTFSPVTNALDTAGDPILPDGYGPGINGLIPDPLVATEDPFPHQVMGYAVDAVEEAGTLWIAVGAPYAGGVSGISAGDTEPECGTYYPSDVTIGPTTGRVLMYTLDPITMTVQNTQTVTADDPAIGMGFGASISISGSRMVVGAPNWQSPTSSGGAVYVFELNGAGLWAQTHRLHQADATNNARFGYAVSLHGDKLVVGAPLQNTPPPPDGDGSQSGAMHRFNFDPATATWAETELLLAPQLGDQISTNPGEQKFGRSVSITDRFVAGGGPQLVNAVFTPGGQLALTSTGAAGLTDSRPLPVPQPLCSGDVDGNENVDIRDIIIMLRGMSQPDLYPQCDVNGDLVINVFDLVDMIDQWGNDC